MGRNRPAEHLRAQREGKKRDLYTCQICGSTDHVEGHHIIDYRFSGAASTDNIITVCKKCHAAIHRGDIDITKF